MDTINPLVQETSTSAERDKFREAVKKNDAFLTAQMLNRFKPTENCRKAGLNHTALHVAAYNNATLAGTVLLKYLADNDGGNYGEIANIANFAGNSPPIIAAKRGNFEILAIFLHFHFYDLSFKDKSGHTITEVIEANCPKAKPLLAISKPYNQVKNLDSFTEIGASKQKGGASKGTLRGAQKVQNHSINKKKDLSSQDESLLEGLAENSQGYQILKDHIGGDKNWEDPKFSPNLEAITDDPGHKYIEEFKKIIWKRPHEIFDKDYDKIHLFDCIEPSDIKQGQLGVCYYLCSLAAMAEFPTRLAEVFNSVRSNKYGVYSLTFYIQGVPTEIVVDDHIPCYHWGKPIFSKPVGDELWVLLAEKAWAKVFGNYTHCESGFMDEALEYLTGLPADRTINKNSTEDEIWNEVYDADQRNYIIAASTHATGDKEKTGLVPGHAYSLISAHDVAGYRIFKMRNPWGKFEWKGDFSDDSNLWTDDIKDEVGYANADDGIFHITVGDFKQHFQNYAICYYEDSWDYCYKKVAADYKKPGYFKFTTEDACQLYIRVHQRDKRHLPRAERSKHDYSPCEIWLARVNEDGSYTPIVTDSKDVDNNSYWGARTTHASKQKRLRIDAGTYIIRTKLRWKEGPQDYVVSTYCDEDIELEQLDHIGDYMQKYMAGMGVTSNKLKYVGDESHGVRMASGYLTVFNWYYFENKGDKTCTINIKFNKMDNLRLRKKFQEAEDSIKVELAPGASECMYMKKKEITGGCSSSYSYSWSFS